MIKDTNRYMKQIGAIFPVIVIRFSAYRLVDFPLISPFFNGIFSTTGAVPMNDPSKGA